MGYEVREHAFAFSALPGRFATPVLGALAAVVVAAACHAGARGERWIPLLVLATGASVLVTLGVWLARYGVLRVPALRQSGRNLEAVRPGERPALWLCAHLDSKSQPVPSLVRSAGVLTVLAGFLLAAGAAVAASGGIVVDASLWRIAAAATLLGAVPVMLSMVGNSSAGAFDNASGVVTVLAAANELRDAARVGVLITDAEELGLAGARAWCERQRSDGRPAAVLNCDGVDDAGSIAVMYTGRAPAELLGAVRRAAAGRNVDYRAMRLLPGLLTDSVAFTDAGIPSVTFSRGSLRSMLRVHTPRDSLRNLRGAGIDSTASLIAGTARVLGS